MVIEPYSVLSIFGFILALHEACALTALWHVIHFPKCCPCLLSECAWSPKTNEGIRSPVLLPRAPELLQMPNKPLLRQVRRLFQGAGPLEEVRGTGNDGQFLFHGKMGEGLPVQLQDLHV